jgi:hypothetical protein
MFVSLDHGRDCCRIPSPSLLIALQAGMCVAVSEVVSRCRYVAVGGSSCQWLQHYANSVAFLWAPLFVPSCSLAIDRLLYVGGRQPASHLTPIPLSSSTSTSSSLSSLSHVRAPSSPPPAPPSLSSLSSLSLSRSCASPYLTIAHLVFSRSRTEANTRTVTTGSTRGSRKNSESTLGIICTSKLPADISAFL